MYHNKTFRAAAETHGLICTRSEKYGWSRTEPSDALLFWILENDVAEISMNRGDLGGIRIAGGNAAANGGAVTGTASKGHSIRYKCPVCGYVHIVPGYWVSYDPPGELEQPHVMNGELARTTKTAKLIYGDCMATMTES